jgi:hypothetical protein
MSYSLIFSISKYKRPGSIVMQLFELGSLNRALLPTSASPI